MKYIAIIIMLSLMYTSCHARVRILLTAALTDAYFEFRKNQYITTFEILSEYGYSEPYVVEALKLQGPTFLESYTSHVCYATTNNPRFKNNGINEARTILESTRFFKFHPDDMILKCTGRYQFTSDYFLRFVEKHADYDAIVRITAEGNVYTLCFAMKCKHLQELYDHTNWDQMERHWILHEHLVGNFVMEKVKQGNFRVLRVDKLDVVANIYGSSTAPGVAEQILYF